MTLPALLILAFTFAQPGATVGKADRPPPAAWVEVKADPILTVLTAPLGSQWFSIDDGAELNPAADGATASFAADGRGRYRIVVISGKELSRVVVVKGDAPKPTPGPDPKPPEPVPVIPADPLTAKLQAAYRLDTRAVEVKSINLKDLIELYKQASEIAGKPEIASLAELVAKVRDAAKLLGIEGLADVRKATAGELAAAFPVDAPFDEASRLKAKVLFVKIANSLKDVK